jgi:hypothetical protein
MFYKYCCFCCCLSNSKNKNEEINDSIRKVRIKMQIENEDLNKTKTKYHQELEDIIERPSENNSNFDLNIELWESSMQEYINLEESVIDNKDMNIILNLISLRVHPNDFLLAKNNILELLAEKRIKVFYWINKLNLIKCKDKLIYDSDLLNIALAASNSSSSSNNNGNNDNNNNNNNRSHNNHKDVDITKSLSNNVNSAAKDNDIEINSTRHIRSSISMNVSNKIAKRTSIGIFIYLNLISLSISLKIIPTIYLYLSSSK